VNVQVIVRGEHEVAALVDRLAQRLEDGTPALMGLVDTMLEIESDRFAGRGQRWRKLAPETRRIDRQQGRDPRPNVNKGDMMRSLTQRGAPGQVVRVRPTSLRFGTSIWYARFAKKLGRNPVGVTRAQRRTLVDELKRLLLKDVK
jgi:hypothetical protein